MANHRWDDLDRRYEDRGYRAADSFERRPAWTAFKWFVGLMLVVAVVVVVGGVFGWWFSWFNTARQLTGPQHTGEQITAVLDDWNGLQAAAGNACDARNAKPNPNDPSLVETPDFAYRAKYRQIKVDYDRRMGNLFEAYVTRHLPLPGSIQHLPTIAPTLGQAEAQFC